MRDWDLTKYITLFPASQNTWHQKIVKLISDFVLDSFLIVVTK